MVYWEHALAYPHHSFKKCGGPEAFTSTIIFEKCGAKISSVRQERCIQKTLLTTKLDCRKGILGGGEVFSSDMPLLYPNHMPYRTW